MEPEQARKLGSYLQKAREAKDMSAAKLGRLTDMSTSSITRIESGEFKSPGADKLARIAGVLDLDVADVYAMADYSRPGLPQLKPYLRTKYRDLPDEALEKIERYTARIAKQHGVALDGPVAGEDEAP